MIEMPLNIATGLRIAYKLKDRKEIVYWNRVWSFYLKHNHNLIDNPIL